MEHVSRQYESRSTIVWKPWVHNEALSGRTLAVWFKMQDLYRLALDSKKEEKIKDKKGGLCLGVDYEALLKEGEE